MKLVIFPGSGSPDNHKYASVYRLLNFAAPAYGYSEVVSSLRWPGHNLNDVLTLNSAVEVAQGKIQELEFDSESYDLLARSFGCYVALKIALEVKPRKLRKVILWGPPPYWLIWEMFCRDLEGGEKKGGNKQKAAEKGVAVDRALFHSIEPIESLLPQVTYETVVATGEQDPYVSPAFLSYLNLIVQQRKSVEFCQSISFKDAVVGAVHEVTENSPKPVIDAYLKALFE